MADEALYDRIGVGYTPTRRTDPRIAEHILAALGDARSVLNVGAGTGSYEPSDRAVVAVEPSAVMLAQRPPGAAPAVRAEAVHRFWLTRDYLPGFLRLIPEPYRQPGAWAQELAVHLGPVGIEPVSVPHDCEDGFYGAFWRRPEAWLPASATAYPSLRA